MAIPFSPAAYGFPLGPWAEPVPLGWLTPELTTPPPQRPRVVPRPNMPPDDWTWLFHVPPAVPPLGWL